MKRIFFLVTLFVFLYQFEYGFANTEECTPDGSYTIIASDIDFEIGQPEPNYVEGVYALDSCENPYPITLYDASAVQLDVVGTYKVYFYYQLAYKVVQFNVHFDLTNPIINVSDEIRIEVNTTYDFLEGVTVVDNKDQEIESTLSVDAVDVDFSKVGAYTITYRAEDVSGNVGTKEVLVVVEDTISPIVDNVLDITIEVKSDLTNFDWWKDIIISDNSNASLTQDIDFKDFNIEQLGVYPITYIVTDESGNKTEKTINISVVDTTSPVINAPEIIFVTTNQSTKLFNLLEDVSGFDNFDGPIEQAKIKVNKLNLDIHKPGIYLIQYLVYDSSGNQTIKEAFVRVIDEDLPLIRNAQDIEVPANAADVDYLEGITAYDETDKDITNRIIVYDDYVDLTQVGEYPLYYVVFDLSGNRCEIEVIVKVFDNEKPVISGVTDLTFEVFSINDFKTGITAYDNLDKDITHLIIIETNADLTVVGTYDITYRVVDSQGNEDEKTAKIHVVDTTKPVLEYYQDINIKKGETIESLKALFPDLKATDNYDGDITDQITFTGHYDLNNVGTYQIKISVTDSNENNRFVYINLIVYEDQNELSSNYTLYYIIGGISATLMGVGLLAYFTRKH